MKGLVYKFSAKVWIYDGDDPWHFVTIEKEDSEEIKKEEPWPRKGFGSIPVKVTIGKTSWNTSIFPEKKGTYVLPIKKLVREQEKIVVGDEIKINLEVVV